MDHLSSVAFRAHLSPSARRVMPKCMGRCLHCKSEAVVVVCTSPYLGAVQGWEEVGPAVCSTTTFGHTGMY